jgi:hypothetical protein
MKRSQSLIVIGFFLMLFIMIEVNAPGAQERSTFQGKVIGIRLRAWLDVESQNDKAVMNFRIGRRTVYTPHRYPNSGEIVKVGYQIQRGIPVAFSVTLVEGTKDAPEEGTKESPPEIPKENERGGVK